MRWGFDSRYFLYNEDVDLCLRLRRAGWRLLFEPGMVCFHAIGGATASADRSPIYLENLTRTRFAPFQVAFVPGLCWRDSHAVQLASRRRTGRFVAALGADPTYRPSFVATWPHCATSSADR